MLTALSALSLAVVLAGSAPDESSPFAGCAATKADGGWTYECAKFTALVRDARQGPEATRELIEGMAKSIARSSFGSAGAAEWEDVRLAGEDARLVHVEAGGQKVFLTALPRAEGTRLLVCFARAWDHCAAALQALAASAWGSAAAEGAEVRDAPPLALLGRPVDVPGGCRGEGNHGGGRILCPPRLLADWFVVKDAARARATIDATEEALAGTGEGELRRDTVPCRFAGKKATCRRTRVRRDGGPVTQLATWVEHDGDTVFASCIAPGERGDARPCSVIFELDGEPLTLLGRPVTVPDACRRNRTSEGGAFVECSAGTVAWNLAPDVETARKVQQDAEAKLADLPGLERKLRACKVQGQETTCLELRTKTPQGEPIVFRSAVVEEKDRALLVTCTRKGIDPACATVFDEE